MLDPTDSCGDDFALFLVALNGLNGGGDELDEVDDVGGGDETCHGFSEIFSCVVDAAFRVSLEP